MNNFFDKLQYKLKYNFKNINILFKSLTHSSISLLNNNERLEFLGDSILNLVITNILYKRFPYANEGKMSKIRSFIIEKSTIAYIAKKINLNKYMFIGNEEKKNFYICGESILSDTFEAVIGGIFLDCNNIYTVDKIIINLFYKRIKNIINYNYKDPKTKLQEYLQSKHLCLPKYNLVNILGEKYKQEFVICCKIEQLCKFTIGKSSSIRKAEKKAAIKMIKILNI